MTGGTGHLGTAVVEALAEAGACVFVCSRDQERSEATAQEIATRTGANVPVDCVMRGWRSWI